MSNSLRPHGLLSTRLLCPWDSPGKNTGVVCHALFHGIFPTKGWNPPLLHFMRILHHWAPWGSPSVCLHLKLKTVTENSRQARIIPKAQDPRQRENECFLIGLLKILSSWLFLEQGLSSGTLIFWMARLGSPALIVLPDYMERIPHE